MRPPPSVWIEGRPYRVGAAYLPGPGPHDAHGKACAPRRLLGYDPDFPWVGGRVVVGVVERTARGERTRRRDMTGRKWVEWAREIAT